MNRFQTQEATVCTRTFFKDGGRTEVTCGQPADEEKICPCGTVRCEECDDISFETIRGKVYCEDCVENVEPSDPPGWEGGFADNH